MMVDHRTARDTRSVRSAPVSTRWSVEQVEAIAPSPSAVTNAQAIATPTRWQATGCDDRAVWGSCRGSGTEPYDTAVDHVGVAFRCTCPSRQVPCKHAIALLLLWVRGQVAGGAPPKKVAAWLARRVARGEGAPGGDEAGGSAGGDASPSGGADSGGDAGDDVPEPLPEPDREAERDERVARMLAGLSELDRWLDDRIRTGLSDPALASYATWDSLAARLVDAQAGSLANRVRRLAGLVGASPDWHEDVLAELGLLHLLAQAGRRLGELPDPLADTVATTVGWQVRKADVLGGVPETDDWVVAGRSDTREDRIEVRRHWLRGRESGAWAMVLSFAAYRQSLDTSLEIGTSVRADLHRYPGGALRALVGVRHGEPAGPAAPSATTVAGACDEIGSMLSGAPWLDRLPATAHAALSLDGARWALTDATGSLPVHDVLGGGDRGVPTMLAVSEGRPVDVTFEWTPHGVIPLAIHLPDRSVDVGPLADPSFVSAA